MDRRLIDSHKLQFHPARISQWQYGKDDWERAKSIYPIYVEVSPVGACNHRCTFCAVDYIGYKTGQLENFEFLFQMGEKGVKSVMFAGEGEPLLHKKINLMVDACHMAGMDSSFTTNGVLLNKLDLEGVSWVKVSVNAGTKETYAKIHKTKEKDWDTVWSNIKEAVKRKGDCEIGVQMVLLPENQDEIPQFEAACEEAGVDYSVIKPYSQHKFSITRQYEGFKPIQIHSTKSVIRENAFRTEEIPYEKCEATPFFWAYLMASGDLYSCSAYLLDDRFRLGNINTQSFSEIWEGEKRRKNWELVRNSLDIHECRLNCRMDKANIYLNDFNRVRNVNFI